MKKSFLYIFLVLVACGPRATLIDEAVNNSLDNISCEQSETSLLDILYEAALSAKDLRDKEVLHDAFTKELGKRKNLSGVNKKIEAVFSDLLNIVPTEKFSDQEELLQVVAELELGDQTSSEKKTRQAEFKKLSNQWHMIGQEVNSGCPSGDRRSPPLPEQQAVPVSGSSLIIQGLRNVMRTAYQSCESPLKPAMSSKTPSVVGISVVGRHSDGIGAKREISDLKAVQDSHYYLQGNVGTSCFDVRQSPMIYDYGGKPKTTNADNSSLNFFSDAGTGTSVLGIDCSGFVFSALATAGLKLAPDKRMKAILVNGLSSTMLVDPVANGLTCFANAQLGKSGSLKPGDIIAIPGHVIIIESTGGDPLGVAKVATKGDCGKLTSKNFDFVIAQSSPSKNGLGINRFVGRDYMDSAPMFKAALETLAKSVCEARFANMDIESKTGQIQVARFTDNAKCFGAHIVLNGEECVSSCSRQAN